MSNYRIVTDSAADMSAAMVEELGVTVLPLCFTMEEKTYEDYPDRRAMPIAAGWGGCAGASLLLGAFHHL